MKTQFSEATYRSQVHRLKLLAQIALAQFPIKVLIIVLGFTVLAAPLKSHAISEVNFAQQMNEIVLPYLEKNLKYDQFESFDRKKINFAILNVAGAKGTIVISPGRTESISTYREWLYDFAQKGYSVAILDHRGQGKSARFLTDSDIGHVDKFEDYVTDFRYFYENEVLKKTKDPHYLFAVSMGAAIASLYMIESPKKFQSAALVAPMIRLNLKPLPELVAHGLANFLSWIGRSTQYAPTVGPFDRNRTFEQNNFTHCRERFEYDDATLLKNNDLIVGGASVGWVREALKATSELRNRAHELHDRVLVFQASEDNFVDVQAQTEFCKNAANCKAITFPNSRHCLQIESDRIRDQVLSESLKFFALSKITHSP